MESGPCTSLDVGYMYDIYHKHLADQIDMGHEIEGEESIENLNEMMKFCSPPGSVAAVKRQEEAKLREEIKKDQNKRSTSWKSPTYRNQCGGPTRYRYGWL